MITNKQSKKQGDSIRVIEDKTPKTLTKKVNKMNNKPNYSINKSIKSVTYNKKFPVYELQENTLIDIKLPNGMKLQLSSNEEGNYCAIRVYNHVKNDKFETTIDDTKDSKTIHTNNYYNFFTNEGIKESGFKFELIEFNR